MAVDAVEARLSDAGLPLDTPLDTPRTRAQRDASRRLDDAKQRAQTRTGLVLPPLLPTVSAVDGANDGEAVAEVVSSAGEGRTPMEHGTDGGGSGAPREDTGMAPTAAEADPSAISLPKAWGKRSQGKLPQSGEGASGKPPTSNRGNKKASKAKAFKALKLGTALLGEESGAPGATSLAEIAAATAAAINGFSAIDSTRGSAPGGKKATSPNSQRGKAKKGSGSCGGSTTASAKAVKPLSLSKLSTPADGSAATSSTRTGSQRAKKGKQSAATPPKRLTADAAGSPALTIADANPNEFLANDSTRAAVSGAAWRTTNVVPVSAAIPLPPSGNENVVSVVTAALQLSVARAEGREGRPLSSRDAISHRSGDGDGNPNAYLAELESDRVGRGRSDVAGGSVSVLAAPATAAVIAPVVGDDDNPNAFLGNESYRAQAP